MNVITKKKIEKTKKSWTESLNFLELPRIGIWKKSDDDSVEESVKNEEKKVKTLIIKKKIEEEESKVVAQLATANWYCCVWFVLIFLWFNWIQRLQV